MTTVIGLTIHLQQSTLTPRMILMTYYIFSFSESCFTIDTFFTQIYKSREDWWHQSLEPTLTDASTRRHSPRNNAYSIDQVIILRRRDYDYRSVLQSPVHEKNLCMCIVQSYLSYTRHTASDVGGRIQFTSLSEELNYFQTPVMVFADRAPGECDGCLFSFDWLVVEDHNIRTK